MGFLPSGYSTLIFKKFASKSFPSLRQNAFWVKLDALKGWENVR
jgi:hypothetical protein